MPFKAFVARSPSSTPKRRTFNVAEIEPGNVTLQVGFADAVVRADDAPLESAKLAFDRVASVQSERCDKRSNVHLFAGSLGGL